MKRLAEANPALLAALARTEITTEDVVALGFRKRQLRVFEKLLTDEEYFAAALAKCKGPEDVWQRFFERNPWIFGYNLSLINFDPLDQRKMEQVVRGFSITGSGKRVDALLKSHALLSTTCFVETKRHDTDLMAENTYRSSIWQPTKELSGAVAQVQGTVSAALESWNAKEDIADNRNASARPAAARRLVAHAAASRPAHRTNSKRSACVRQGRNGIKLRGRSAGKGAASRSFSQS